MRTSVLNTVLAAAVVVGAACAGPDTVTEGATDTFAFVVRGANVLPQPSDTTPEAGGTFNSTSLAWTLNVVKAPATGTIDSIGIYQLAASATNCAATTCGTLATGTPAPGAANTRAAVLLCGSTAACGATSGTGVLDATATSASVRTLLRGYGGQLIVFTTTVRSQGVMRGTPYFDEP